MAVSYEQHSPENGAIDCINQCFDNIDPEDNAIHLLYNDHFAATLFESYNIALINDDEQPFDNKWQITDPKFWSSEDVLDWLYYIGEENDVDFKNFSAESFQCLKGEDLLLMPQQEFCRCEPTYGELIHSSFLRLTCQKMDELNCQATGPNARMSETNVYTAIREIMGIEYDDQTYCKEYLNNFPVNNPLPCSSSNLPDSSSHLPCSSSHLPCSSSHLPSTSDVFQPDSNQTQYNILQPKIECQIDEETDCFQNLSYTTLTMKMECESEPDLPSLSETKIKEEDNLYVSHSPKSPEQMNRNVTNPSCTSNKRKAPSSPSKSRLKRRNIKKTRAGNHLWEFIRDLLHDEEYNPKYIRWEDHENGVFRFTASEEVATLWGIKKNNDTMNYEKLSRAMRFSRSVGYFTKLPANGIYPKKLCFKFGPKAFGWRKK